ncbi:hypothetical protein Pst134EA_027118 [Puccinia striiformis f. sp. tritici]|uniref:hypothetical protein n=1 Tax=Puccinia striiformis f. sp. tritici TaxID=168172 RepID=UPI0020078F5B|nr:hypothetical protein Pst134EA_027118 [Puccinia striiformis f. sp. tritici]KAH9450417.1 hypothetical protein Pst134EA_027118 [Puccinia striiformis f. sp. tritici]
MAELRQELQAARQARPPPPPPPPPVPIFNNREEQILLSFLRAPVKTHKEHNKNHPVLSFLGENFPRWQKSIDRTLRHAFCLNHSWFNVETNFDHVANDTKSSICGLLRNTVVNNLSALVEELDEPSAIYKFLKMCCSHSDQRQKITLVVKLVNLITNTSAGDDSTIAKWTAVQSEITRMKLTLDEMFGIFLQSYFKPPSDIDRQRYDFSVDQALNDKKSPGFEKVAETIQYVMGKLKSITDTSMSVPDPMAMDLDKNQAMQSNQRYVAPHRRNNRVEEKATKSFSVEKASFYRGKGQSDALTAKYGDKCVYCKVKGHWYSDCTDFWRDVAMKQIPAPPDNHMDKDST